MTEAAQPARPISSADPAAERVAGDVRALDPALLAGRVQRRGQVGGGRLDPVGQRRRRAEAGHVEHEHLALGLEQRQHRVPDRPRAAEPVEQQQRLAAAAAHRHPGFANSACTSPIRRSRKPASEEER